VKIYETNFSLLFSPPWLQSPCSGCWCTSCWWPRTFPSRPAPTVYGPTPRRLWATAVAGLALVGVVSGGLALPQAAGPIGSGNGRSGAIVALVAGPIAVVNGALNFALATGGPGSGNGVVGGAAGMVLGLIATVLGGLALAHRASRPGRRGATEPRCLIHGKGLRFFFSTR